MVTANEVVKKYSRSGSVSSLLEPEPIWNGKYPCQNYGTRMNGFSYCEACPDKTSANCTILTKCAKDDHPKGFMERRDDNGSSEVVCLKCGTVVRRVTALPKDESEVGGPVAMKFGRSANAALVMDNNNGTAPGPERRRQIYSALNAARSKQQKKRKLNGETSEAAEGDGKQGLEFHMGSLDLLTLWNMSGDPTDHKVSELLTLTIRQVEKKRGIKIRQERVDFIARSCKAGVKEAEKVKRLTPSLMKGMIERQFMREGYWPP